MYNSGSSFWSSINAKLLTIESGLGQCTRLYILHTVVRLLLDSVYYYTTSRLNDLMSLWREKERRKKLRGRKCLGNGENTCAASSSLIETGGVSCLLLQSANERKSSNNNPFSESRF